MVLGVLLGRAEKNRVPEGVALFGGISLVLCPHVFPYDFILLLPLPAVCLVSWMHRQSHLSRLVLVSWAGLSGAYIVLKTLFEEESLFWWLPWMCLIMTVGVLFSALQVEKGLSGRRQVRKGSGAG
jgi:hypothetical protein